MFAVSQVLTSSIVGLTRTDLAGLFKPVQLRRVGLALCLTGEAGIGKTFTATQLAASSGLRSFEVHATASLSDIARILPKPVKLPAWAERLPGILERTGYLEANQAAEFLAALLNALAPLILRVEDLHEATAQQLEFWAKLAGMVARTKGLALLATSRNPAPETFKSFQLQVLELSEIKALLETEMGSSLPEEAISWIQTRAAGNPLFALEYVRALARAGNVWNDLQRWRWRAPTNSNVPVSIEALIETMLRKLDDAPESRQALEARAILPQHASLDLWQKVSGLTQENLEQAQEKLEQRGLLIQDALVHPLYREILVRSLEPARHRELARRALEALETQDPRAAAAFVRDAGLEPARALEVLERAAQVAGDSVQAGLFLEQATDFASGEKRGQLALEAMKGLHSSFLDAAIRMAELAVSELRDNTEAIYDLAELYAAEHRMVEVNRTLEKLPALEREGAEWWRRLIVMKSWEEHSTEVLELWDAHPEWQENASPYLIYRVVFAMPANQNPRRIALAEHALERPNLSLVERAQLLSVLASVYYHEFRPVQSVALNTQALSLIRQAGHRIGEATILHNRSSALWDADRYTECQADIEVSLKINIEIGSPSGVAESQQNLAEWLTEMGEYERAEAMLLEALEVLQRVAPTGHLVDCEESFRDLYLCWQPPHGAVMALKHAQAALRVAQGLGIAIEMNKGLRSMAMALNENGDHAQALIRANENIALCKANNLKYPTNTHIEHALALEGLGKPNEALELLHQIAAVIPKTESQKTNHEVGLEIDRMTNNLESARERLAWFTANRLIDKARRVRRYFPELEASTPQANEPTIESQIKLELLGTAVLSLNGDAIGKRGGKRLELLALLLEARITGRSDVSKLELTDSLYPDTSEDQASQALKKLVQLVRSSLGRDAVQTAAGGYALGAVSSDAENFLQTGNTDLWRGAYLTGLNLERTDDTVRDALYHALKLAAKNKLEIDPNETARVARILLEADPYDLEALELGLLALRSTDNHRSLNRVYQEAKERFLEIAERLPERWQDFLNARELTTRV